MEINQQEINQQLATIAAQFEARRDLILECWLAAINDDPLLPNSAALTRAQFFDHIPTFLTDVCDALRLGSAFDRKPDHRVGEELQDRDAMEHGLDRWHQGYQLVEVMREWRHLHLCLVDALNALEKEMSDAEVDGNREAFGVARKILAKVCSDGVCASAVQYAELQRTEAEGRMRDLEGALHAFNEEDVRRAEAWHEAAHDLRGSLGVVNTATVVLGSSKAAEETRHRSLGILQRSVKSMLAMLNDLLNLARLEAGRESLNLAPVDIPQLLIELCKSLQQQADNRKLVLDHSGPAVLRVEGDAVKIHRLAQNLLLNALSYTEEGKVHVSWAAHEKAGTAQWILRIEDTGPGFATGSAAPLSQALKAATAKEQDGSTIGTSLGQEAEQDRQLKPAVSTAPSTNSYLSLIKPIAAKTGGEGIGLSIVKRLCELMHATLQLESEVGKGTTFQITFPQSYEGLR